MVFERLSRPFTQQKAIGRYVVWRAESSRPTTSAAPGARLGSRDPHKSNFRRAVLPFKKIFFTCHKSALPVDIPYRRTSAGAEEKGGHAMTGRKKRSLLPVVGLVAVAAAALLFLGVWTQASRADNWAQEPSQVPFVLACPDFA